MPFTAPIKILVTSDENELTHVRTIKNKNGDVYVYKFIKSITKLNMEVEFTESSLIRYLDYSFKII